MSSCIAHCNMLTLYTFQDLEASISEASMHKPDIFTSAYEGCTSLLQYWVNSDAIFLQILMKVAKSISWRNWIKRIFVQVLIDGKAAGTLERNVPRNLTLVPPTRIADSNVQLDIVVHAMGRVNFGCVWDFKGLVFPDVKLNGKVTLMSLLTFLSINWIPSRSLWKSPSWHQA